MTLDEMRAQAAEARHRLEQDIERDMRIARWCGWAGLILAVAAVVLNLVAYFAKGAPQ